MKNQDTFEVIVEALNRIAGNKGLPIVGYFGDPMQQIYDTGVGDFSRDENLEDISKVENYRCSTEVIKLLNSFRTDIKQKQAGQDNTQHGVKGEEYDKVLVFYDDIEANWSKFSFAKLLTPQSAGKEPTEKQKKRSTKLAYVSFSRAKKDLAIILFTPNVETARKELIKQGYFSEDQIENLDE